MGAETTGPVIFGMMGQYNPGKVKDRAKPGKHYAVAETYEKRRKWFREALKAIGKRKDIKIVSFPEEVGCDMAGGDWKNYLQMLIKFRMEYPHIQVKVVRWLNNPRRRVARPGTPSGLTVKACQGSEKAKITICGIFTYRGG